MVETPPTGRFDGRCVVPRKPPSASLLRLPKFTCFVVCLGLSDVSLVTLLDPIHLLLRVAPAPVSNQDHPSHETYPSPVFAARDRSRRDRRRHLPLWRAPNSGGRARRASCHVDDTWAHQALALPFQRNASFGRVRHTRRGANLQNGSRRSKPSPALRGPSNRYFRRRCPP